MSWLKRYKKALAALLVGVAAAVALAPSDAPAWLLALVPLANVLVVAFAPANKAKTAPPPP